MQTLHKRPSIGCRAERFTGRTDSPNRSTTSNKVAASGTALASPTINAKSSNILHKEHSVELDRQIGRIVDGRAFAAENELPISLGIPGAVSIGGVSFVSSSHMRIYPAHAEHACSQKFPAFCQSIDGLLTRSGKLATGSWAAGFLDLYARKIVLPFLPSSDHQARIVVAHNTKLRAPAPDTLNAPQLYISLQQKHPKLWAPKHWTRSHRSRNSNPQMFRNSHLATITLGVSGLAGLRGSRLRI